MLIHAGSKDDAKKVLEKSKFRNLADGQRKLLKVLRKYGKYNRDGRLFYLRNVSNVESFGELAMSSKKRLEELLISGNIEDVEASVFNIFDSILDPKLRVPIMKIGEIVARLVL